MRREVRTISGATLLALMASTLVGVTLAQDDGASLTRSDGSALVDEPCEPSAAAEALGRVGAWRESLEGRIPEWQQALDETVGSPEYQASTLVLTTSSRGLGRALEEVELPGALSTSTVVTSLNEEAAAIRESSEAASAEGTAPALDFPETMARLDALTTELSSLDQCAPTERAYGLADLEQDQGKPTAMEVARLLSRASEGDSSVPDLGKAFTDRCAKTWQKPNAAERKQARASACLMLLAQSWRRYDATWADSDEWFEATKAVHDYVGSSLGKPTQRDSVKSLKRFDVLLAAPPETAAEPKALKTVLKVPVRRATPKRLRNMETTALYKNLFGLCGDPDSYQCQPPESMWQTGNRFLEVPMVSGCQYASAATSQLDHGCRDGAMSVWQMYQATGDRAFYDLFVGMRDLYMQRYRGPAKYLGKSMDFWFVHGVGCAVGEQLPKTRC